MRVSGIVVALASVVLVTVPGFADVEDISVPAATHVREAVAQQQPLRSGEKLAVAPAAVLAAAASAEATRLQEMISRNQAGIKPTQDGFTRALDTPVEVVLTAASKQKGGAAGPGMLAVNAKGELVFMVRVDVSDAWGVRLHLVDVKLPKSASLWVYSPDQQASAPFSLELLRADNDIWCPSTFGSVVWLEVAIADADFAAGAEYGFTISEVAELFPPRVLTGKAADDDFSCLVDGPCENLSPYGLSNYQNAVAHLRFVVDGGTYICSGGLVNDTTAGFIPYLLTANHCFDTQNTASTLEAYFDYRNAGCNGTTPSLGTLPRTTGATLLATGAATDFTFVQLSAEPTGSRTYLGWTTANQTNNTVLHRLSHPDGLPLAYSRSRLVTSATYECDGNPRPEFIYSLHTYGGTWGGSSGAPVVIENGQIVGQLLGDCGPADGWDDCDADISVLDGAMGSTFGHISAWINQETASDCESTIALNSTVGGVWASDCSSTSRSGGYAKFYTFTLQATTPVEIDLTSSIDTYLFLLSGSGSGGSEIANDDDGGDGTNSYLYQTLAAGTYTIEATTFNQAETGTFSLVLTGDTGTVDCTASISVGGSRSGEWTGDCSSTHRSGRYARYYTFSLGSTTEVKIDLVANVDSYLYLLSGSGSSGSEITSDDDSGEDRDAQITRTLNAGSYTIEATTYPTGTTGTFTLALAEVSGVDFNHQYIVAGIAAASGAGGSFWKSYLSVANLSGRTANLELIYWHSSGSVTRNRQLSDGDTVGWDNVVSSLFSVSGASSGAVEVLSDQPVIVQARTFNDTPNGTYGQYLPGVASPDMISSSVDGFLGQLRNTSVFRTNVGFVNLGSSACNVRVTLYSTAGNRLGSAVTTSVGARAWRQINDIFNQAGYGTADLAYAVVEVTTSGGQVWAYASVVDGDSGDPTTIPVVAIN